jgi:hypothetical protein
VILRAAVFTFALLSVPVMARAQGLVGQPVTPIPLRFAIQTEGARGAVTGPFYNHMLGARLDLVVSPHISFGGYLGYVNLKGKDGRTGNLLPYASIEYLAGDPIATTRLLLRFASGYLPNNGPVARMAGGVAISLSARTQLIAEIAPMFWVTNDQMLLSINGAIELAWRI